jgi:superfamily II DNA or RNA helicase
MPLYYIIQIKMSLNYLGPKGYTIYKSNISNIQQQQMKNDLTIKPYTQGAPPGAAVSFPAYRESANKLYVPHYYGVQQLGPPPEIKISEGTNINLHFAGQLRDYQRPVVEKFINHVKGGKAPLGPPIKLDKAPSGGLLELPCAWGKTSGSLYILSMLAKKALVIVHKEFLMNQWVERIQQFLPEARIGKIQGATIDIEDKDIVLCMLQSLVGKEYPSDLFTSFGLTIIDEVHHISSQTFSNALFKVVTKYMLGLSATMNRKDGTTKVFKLFLGDVIHKAETKTETEVEVRATYYTTNDAEFNATILDFKGQPQISSMISKISSYARRTEFIISHLCAFIRNGSEEQCLQHKAHMDAAIPPCGRCAKTVHYLVKNTCCGIVKYCLQCLQSHEINSATTTASGRKQRVKCPDCKKVLAFEQNYVENPFVAPLSQRHTIVLSHNLNVLEYMYNKIVCNNLASVGYYVGGMSEQELKMSETKQVILATFSMAAEGLDIPTLNAEFLISPKTDVVQAVGRILRAKHATSKPIIYDFIDSHQTFRRQWMKRRAFYRKQKYCIVDTQYADEEEEDGEGGEENKGKCLITLTKK